MPVSEEHFGSPDMLHVAPYMRYEFVVDQAWSVACSCQD